MTKKKSGRNPYSGTTLHPKSRWCGATGSFVTEDGREINLICTRFKGHKTESKKDPLRHFDEVKRRSWYDDDPQPCEASPG